MLETNDTNDTGGVHNASSMTDSHSDDQHRVLHASGMHNNSFIRFSKEQVLHVMTASS